MKCCLNHKERKVFAKGLYAQCYKRKYTKPLKRSPLKRKPFFIKPVSDKRKRQRKEYKPKRDRYLKEHPLCELKVDGNCTKIATQIHHTKGTENELLLDEKYWKSGCDYCHRKVTDDSKKAIEEGQSVSRHKKE